MKCQLNLVTQSRHFLFQFFNLLLDRSTSSLKHKIVSAVKILHCNFGTIPNWGVQPFEVVGNTEKLLHLPVILGFYFFQWWPEPELALPVHYLGRQTSELNSDLFSILMNIFSSKTFITETTTTTPTTNCT